MKCGPVCAPVCGSGALASQTDPDSADWLHFLKDEGTKTVSWKFVGEGNGNFTPVQNYNYVGQGLGSFDKKVEPNPPPSNKQKIYMGLGLLMLFFVVVALFSLPSLAKGVHDTRNDTRKEGPIAGVTAPHNCEVGNLNWAEAWPDEKKAWCCSHYGTGCPSERGCDAICTYVGKSATCRVRVQWGASHRFLHQSDSCAQAHRMVQQECTICGGCGLVDVGCLPS